MSNCAVAPPRRCLRLRFLNHGCLACPVPRPDLPFDPRMLKALAFEDLRVGMREILLKTVMDTDVVGFARLSGDDNPIHLCDTYAAGSRFGERIAHGLYTASLISAVLGTRLPGPGAVYRSQTSISTPRCGSGGGDRDGRGGRAHAPGAQGATGLRGERRRPRRARTARRWYRCRRGRLDLPGRRTARSARPTPSTLGFQRPMIDRSPARPSFIVARGDISHAAPGEDALRGAVVAIGNFEGVHRGHRAVIDVALGRAPRARAQSRGAHLRAASARHLQAGRAGLPPERRGAKLRLLAQTGLDGAIVLRFDTALASLPAEDFVRQILIERFAVAAVVVGFDFHFGRGRGGSPEFLTAAGRLSRLHVDIVPPFLRRRPAHFLRPRSAPRSRPARSRRRPACSDIPGS